MISSIKSVKILFGMRESKTISTIYFSFDKKKNYSKNPSSLILYIYLIKITKRNSFWTIILTLENLKMGYLFPKSLINQTPKYNRQPSIATSSIYSLNEVAHIHPPVQHILFTQTIDQDLYQSKISTQMLRPPCMKLLMEQTLTTVRRVLERTSSIYCLNEVVHIHPPVQHIVVAQTIDQGLHQSKISTRMSRRPCMKLLVEQTLVIGTAKW